MLLSSYFNGVVRVLEFGGGGAGDGWGLVDPANSFPPHPSSSLFLFLCLVLGSSWQAQCLAPASGCLGWAPSAPSGDGTSGGGGWLGGPMSLGLCLGALVVLAGVLPGSVCSTLDPTGSFQSLCCHGASGMSHQFSVRSWSMSCGLW